MIEPSPQEQPIPKPPAQRRISRRTGPRDRKRYAQLRDLVIAGSTIAEAAAAVGVSEKTGAKWCQWIESERDKQSLPLTRELALRSLETWIKESPVQYRAALVTLLVKLRGWDSPDGGDRNRSKPIAELIAAWRAEAE